MDIQQMIANAGIFNIIGTVLIIGLLVYGFMYKSNKGD